MVDLLSKDDVYYSDRDNPPYLTYDRSSHPTHPHLVALELDTNDGHGTIKSEPAPRKRENWIENREPIPNPNQPLI
jgi:hypothetical protein